MVTCEDRLWFKKRGTEGEGEGSPLWSLGPWLELERDVIAGGTAKPLACGKMDCNKDTDKREAGLWVPNLNELESVNPDEQIQVGSGTNLQP